MELFKVFKDLIRSGSVNFVKARRPASKSKPARILALNWKGNQIHYRSCTSDRGLIYEVLLRSPRKTEYFVPKNIQREVVLDIGANVGVVSLWLAEKHPSAMIHAFDSMPENTAHLRTNNQHKSKFVEGTERFQEDPVLLRS